MTKHDEIHRCKIVQQASMSFLPEIPPDKRSNPIRRFMRCFKKSTLISEQHPQSIEYYRSVAEIQRLRKRHVEAGTRLIHPFSIFRTYYEMYLCVALSAILIYIPLDAAFDLANHEQHHDMRNFEPHNFRPEIFIYNLILIFDIVLTFFSGYAVQEKRIVVMKPHKIAKKYFLGFFFIDVLAAIPEPWGKNVRHRDQRVFSALSLLKIFRLHTLLQTLTHSCEYLRFKASTAQTLKSFFMIMIMLHWLACSQFIIPQARLFLYGDYAENSWVLDHEEPKSTFELYVMCFYRTSGYIFSANFEERQLTVWEEKTLAIVTYIFGRVCLAYCTVMIMQQLLERRALESKYQEIITQVQSYMSQKHLPLHMQARILQYYRYKFSQRYFKESAIYGLLSDTLKADVNLNSCSKLVENVSLLKNLQYPQLQQVVTSLQIEIYLPNDMIIKAGSVGDCMYFISSGTVAVWTPSGKEVCHLQDGAYFGEIAIIFKDKRRTANIIAIEICEVFKLNRRAFKSCFKGASSLLVSLEETARERLEITEMYEAEMKKNFMEKNFA